MRDSARILSLTLGALVLLAVLWDGGHPPALGQGEMPVPHESFTKVQFDPVPAWALVDEITPLRLRGAPPGQTVTLQLRSRDGRGRTLESHATFRAASDGHIDVATDAPLSGTYEGVDPTGLFWSRVPTDAPPEGPAPLPTATWQVTAAIAGQTVAAFAQERRYASPEVTRTPVRDEGFVGTLYAPAGADRRPAVLTVGGSSGGLAFADSMAALLASHGYTTLALAYFGMEGLPATIPVERIQGPVLLISGQADRIWPSERLADIAFRRLQAHAFPHPYEHLRYEDAGHGIGWPNVPTTETTFTHPVSGVQSNLGGTARGTAFASSDSWVRMLRFLEAALTRPPDH